MKDMLDAVDNRRAVRAFQNVHDAFESQESGSAMFGERLKKQRQRHGPDRLLAHDRVGVDSMMLGPVLVGTSFRTEPRLDVERPDERIIEAAAEEARRVDLTILCRQYRGCRVEHPQSLHERG